MITTKAGEKYIQKYLPTEFEFTKDFWKKMHGKRATPIQENKRDEVKAVVDRARDLANKITPFDFEIFKKKFNSDQDPKTLMGAFNIVIDEIEKSRPGTALSYRCAIVSLEGNKSADNVFKELVIEL